MAVGRGRREPEPQELRAGVVTSLAAKGARGERLAVYLDGKHAFDLSSTIALQAQLRKDEFLSAELQATLLREDEPYRARDAALGMLARRELSRHEVTEKLLKAGISEGGAAATVEWLEERDYVDDHRYAAAYAAQRLKVGWGRQRIVSELLRKGLDRDLLAGEAWGELLATQGASDDMGPLLELLRRRFAGQLRTDPDAAKRRITGFLARRGHDWQTISAAVKALSGGCQPSDDDLS